MFNFLSHRNMTKPLTAAQINCFLFNFVPWPFVLNMGKETLEMRTIRRPKY